jgi:hypothetical protein
MTYLKEILSIVQESRQSSVSHIAIRIYGQILIPNFDSWYCNSNSGREKKKKQNMCTKLASQSASVKIKLHKKFTFPNVQRQGLFIKSPPAATATAFTEEQEPDPKTKKTHTYTQTSTWVQQLLVQSVAHFHQDLLVFIFIRFQQVVKKLPSLHRGEQSDVHMLPASGSRI